jgi:predicted dehydrogenase
LHQDLFEQSGEASVMDEKVRYAVAGAGWIAQEAFLPVLAHTGNSVLGALVTGSPAPTADRGAGTD